MSGRILAALALLFLRAGTAGDAGAPSILEAGREGDRAVLERVLAETQARTEVSETAWSDYAGVLAEAGMRWLAGRLAPLGGLFHVGPRVLRAVAWLVLASLVLVVVLVGLRLYASWRRPARERGAPVTDEAPAASGAAALPPDAWTLELERRLADADARRALEALWWWLARALAGSAALPSWTTRELLREARRPDLAREGHVLDRLLYAATQPAMGEVRKLASRLREVVA